MQAPVWPLALPFLTLSLLALTVQFGTPVARAANVVNVTFHVPAQVEINPCFPGDVVNLNGDIHIVLTTTDDGRGGYHVTEHLNSYLSGVSITTGAKYVSSETQDKEWYARPPFPVIHTNTYDFLLLSQSGTDNYVMHMTMHVTLNATGVPTATVDQVRMECQG